MTSSHLFHTKHRLYADGEDHDSRRVITTIVDAPQSPYSCEEPVLGAEFGEYS